MAERKRRRDVDPRAMRGSSIAEGSGGAIDGALGVVLTAIRQDPTSDFAKRAFLGVLQLLPPVPRVPGAAVFFELARKMVPTAVELILIRDGKVYLTHRSDEYYAGWHFPGTYREPRATLLQDAVRCAAREFGPNVRILGAHRVGWEEHPEDARFHDAGMLTRCEFLGEPSGGRWFSDQPHDLIPEHVKYWPTIASLLHRGP